MVGWLQVTGLLATGLQVTDLLGGLLETTGPFLIPVVVFALGLAGYGVLWAYYRWREDRRAS